MNEQIILLVELQKLDTVIINHSRIIKDIPNRINSMQQPLKEAEAEMELAQKKFETLDKRKRDREIAVDENNDRLEKLKGRTGDIKDNKAYQAHLKEITALEKTTRKLEDDVLESMESIEAAEVRQKVTVEAHALEVEKVAALKKVLDAEVEEARAGLGSMKANRSAIVSKIEKDSFEAYMDILGDNKGLAVTTIEDEICGGCNMNVMPQLSVEIKRNDKIIHCPQCRSILYYVAPVPDDAEVEPEVEPKR